MGESIASRVAKMPSAERLRFMRPFLRMGHDLRYDWRFWARPEQIAPDGEWATWLIQAGRGFGKTRAGAEWVRERARANPQAKIALVGRTAADVRDVMVEGPAGILAISPPDFRPWYEPSKRRLLWPNGAKAMTYSSEEPDQLRGPQHTDAWGDEVAAWYSDDPWNQLMLGLRMGSDPRAVVTTTPRPTPLIRSIVAQHGTIVTRGSTYDNRANLAAGFIRQILTKYDGTRLGRQEIYGEILDDTPGALWSYGMLDKYRISTAPAMHRIVIAIDPAVSYTEDSDETGIIAAGVDQQNPPHAYILADLSRRAKPEDWAADAIAYFHRMKADRIVAEVNQGGDLVESLLRAIDRNIPLSKVHARKGKALRAEPVAALTEQGRVHIVGGLRLLEDQLATWQPGSDKKSPDRLDAMVYAVTELLLGNAGDPRLRVL